MHYLCDLVDVPLGEGLRLTTLGLPIAVFRTDDDQVHAIDDTCTHQDASLADGWLEGCWVECPLHASRFDLRTGAVDAPPAKRPVRVHSVVVHEGRVLVDLALESPNLPPGLVEEAS